jgi:hypothetical protein
MRQWFEKATSDEAHGGGRSPVCSGAGGKIWDSGRSSRSRPVRAHTERLTGGPRLV